MAEEIAVPAKVLREQAHALGEEISRAFEDGRTHTARELVTVCEAAHNAAGDNSSNFVPFKADYASTLCAFSVSGEYHDSLKSILINNGVWDEE
jgi:hypothetical protein